MPGIFGLANTKANGSIGPLLRSMAARMRHFPWYKEELHHEAQAGVAFGRMRLDFQNPELPRDEAAADALLAVVDGEIYDADAQRQSLGVAGHHPPCHGHGGLLASGYALNGNAFLRGLHGKFAGVIWDRRHQLLILVNDRFGMRPLYYAHLPGRLVFASEIKALLADPALRPATDMRGLAQFFTFGQLLGEDTLLEGVRVLPSAGVLTYHLREDRLQLGRYWQPAGGPGPGSSNDSAASLERIDSAFETAVRRCSAGVSNLGLSLSGGLDSRTILGVMDDDQPLTAVSLGMPGSADHRAAAELSRLTNRRHHQCYLGENFLERFEEHLRTMVRLTDGHYLSQCIVMPTLPVYRELGIQVLLRGHAGELMHMRKAYNFSLDGKALALRDQERLEEWLFGHLQAYLLAGTGAGLFAPRHRQQIPELARESLRNCISESDGIQPPVQRIWHLFLSQRLRRETALSLVKFGSQVETRLPYLDNELVDALFAAPVNLKLDDAIQAHILRKRRPSLMRVTNVNTGAPMTVGPMGRFVGKVRQKVFAKLGVRGYQPYERLGLWLRRDLRPLVQKLLLSAECLERGILDPAAVRTVVDSHFQGKNHTFLLLALMTFEMGQRELARQPNSTAAWTDASAGSVIPPVAAAAN